MLVGPETSDDAGVYLLTDDIALVQTLDFITPIVDDPRAFGAIAAANSLSDVYAMGGTPVTALSITCFPDKEADIEILAEILKGAADKCREAGCLILGGHTVSDPELKYGLSVTGTVHPRRIVTNAGVRSGDRLVLTKPLGTGIVATAIKKGKASAAAAAAMTRSMLALNAAAAALMVEYEAHAATDITGFGLAGHTYQMAHASGLALRIEARALGALEGALELADRFYTGGDGRNREYVASFLSVEGKLDSARERLLYDPQTSGGLFVALAAGRADAYVTALHGAGIAEARVVGEAVDGRPGTITIVA